MSEIEFKCLTEPLAVMLTGNGCVYCKRCDNCNFWIDILIRIDPDNY